MSSPSWRREEEQRTQREYSWNYAAEGRGPSLSEKPSVYANYPTPSDGIGRQNVIPNYTPIERTSPMSFKAPTSKNKKIVIKETPQPSPSTYNKLSSAVGYITSPVKYITSMFSSRSEEATAEPAKKKIDVITKEKLKDASVLSVPVEQAKDRKEKKAAPTITIGDDKLKAPTEVTTLDGIKDLKAKLETVSNSKGKRNSGSGMRKNSNQGNKRAVSPHENKSRKTSVSPHENRKPMQVKQIKIEQSRNKSSFRIKSPDALEAQEKLEASFQNQQDSYRRRTLQKYVSSKSSDRRANQETDENLENGSNTQFGKWNHIQRPRPVRITSRKPENPAAQTGDVIVKNEVFNHSVLPVQTDIRKSTRNAPDRSNSASSHFTPIEPVVQDETVKRSTSITPSKIGGKTFAAYKEASKATPPVTSQGETQVVQTKPSDESPSAAPEKSADGINHLNVYSDERRTSPLKIKPQKKDRQKKGDNSSVETKKSQPSAGSGNATLNSAKGTSPIHNLKLENKTTSLETENNSPDVTPVSKTPPQERSRSVSKSPNRKSKSSVRKSSPLPIRKSSPSPVQKSSASPVNKLPGVLERKPIAPKRKRSTSRSPGPRRSRSRSASSASPVNKFFPKGSNSKLVKSFQTKQSQQQQWQQQQQLRNRPFNPNRPTPTVIPSPKIDESKKMLILRQKKLPATNEEPPPSEPTRIPLTASTSSLEKDPESNILSSQTKSDVQESEESSEKEQVQDPAPDNVSLISSSTDIEQDTESLSPSIPSCSPTEKKELVETGDEECIRKTGVSDSDEHVCRKEIVFSPKRGPVIKGNHLNSSAYDSAPPTMPSFSHKFTNFKNILSTENHTESVLPDVEANRFQSPWNDTSSEKPSRFSSRFPSNPEPRVYPAPSEYLPTIKSQPPKPSPADPEPVTSTSDSLSTPPQSLDASDNLSVQSQNSATDLDISHSTLANDQSALSAMDVNSSLSQYSGNPVDFAAAATMLGEIP